VPAGSAGTKPVQPPIRSQFLVMAAIVTMLPLSTRAALLPGTAVINEFHYNSLDPTSLEEFVELYNPGDAPLDISGWSLASSVTFTMPAGTSIPARGYKVIGENPATLQTKFTITGVLGPWTGHLSRTGETIDLRDAAGSLMDRVSYSAGFPWPTAADGAGPSCELLHPSLDNDLGGSWRSSGATGTAAATFIAAGASGWKYQKGTAEASTPVDAWRTVAYNDTAWPTGQTPIGYGTSVACATTLADMKGVEISNYTTVYARKSFTVTAGQIPQTLTLSVLYDDGCVIWINGTEVFRTNMPAGQVAYNAVATATIGTAAWSTITLPNTASYLFGGTNVLTILGANVSQNGSSDFNLNVDLSSPATAGSSSPTPGTANRAAQVSNKIAPQARQVVHTPTSPVPNQPVTVTAHITDPDGMGAVTLAYQVVSPGAYIRKTDAAYASSWTALAMVDDGSNGDTVAGDSVYTAVLPARLQTNRSLVRYKIAFADLLGNAQSVPYADDEQPNFAYFVYAGVPAWTGAIRPTAFNGFAATASQTYPSSLLASLPPFQLIATATDIYNCQYSGSYDATRFYCTVVERGVVFDHIQYSVRGIISTHVSGKNKWNIYFNRARDYQAYDNYGKPYAATWNNLLINGNASPWASLHRGSAGVEEASSSRIFQLFGLPSMNTQYMHLRVIDDALESSPTSQYEGDLWGLYLGLEPTEGNFLNERALADGNLYAIEGGAGDKKHQGATQVVDSSDWNSFSAGLVAAGQTEQWYRDNIDLPTLYTFLALNRLVGNVDLRPGDNYRFYHRPTDNRWVIIPYDLDMMYIAAHHWGGTMDNSIVVASAPNAIRAISRWPNIAREYRNRCREVLSLMGSDGSANGGQIGQLIDEYAQFVNPTGQSLTWAKLDAAMWNLNPHTPGDGANSGYTSHKGNFFRATYLDGTRGGLGGTTQTGSWLRTLADADADGFSDHAGMMQWLVNYATNSWPGGTWNRKAMPGIGAGADADANRQKGFGYKYLEFEALYGGWVDCNSNPTTAANTDYPNKPTISYAGAAGYPVNGLSFASSLFSDPQGAATYAAHEWRLAELQAPGLAGYVAGNPRKYEAQTLWTSGERSAAPGTFAIPLGITEPGKTYRIRVRHKDSTGNWSYWSQPLQFGATPAAPSVLIHYWNFNKTAALLDPAQTPGGATLAVAGTSLADDGEGFAARNARNGDAASTHLRVNNPLTAGTMVSAAIPTTGFRNIFVKYESRRSTQGAGTQAVAYTVDGSTYIPWTTLTVPDAEPVVATLDFRALAAANNNPRFGLRITFAQGAGGIAGNNRFDNLTVEAAALPGDPVLVPGGDAEWNIAGNWSSAAVPNGPAARAIIGVPASASRAVTLSAPVTIGSLEMNLGASSFCNQISGSAGSALTFNGGASTALLSAAGSGSGYVELDMPGGVYLTTPLRLDVSNIEGDMDNGGLRLRQIWDGPGGLIKQGLGVASLTGDGKIFSGPLLIAEGVVQVTQPAVPGRTSGISVQAGGQLRLISGNDGNGARSHSFGGALVLAGAGRGPAIVESEHNGVLGALRFDPLPEGINRAIVTNAISLTADTDIHSAGPDNTLELTGAVTGTGTLTKSGAGALVLGGASPAFAGPLVVASGALEINANWSATPVQLTTGTVLSGRGTTGPLSGSGTLAPRLTTLSAASCALPAAEFVLQYPGTAGNSLLRLTQAAPFPAAPASVDLFVNIAAPAAGVRLGGGFFTPAAHDLAATLAATQVRLLVADPAGTISHLGTPYRLAAPSDQLTWAVAAQALDFGSGPVAGRLLEVLVGGNPVTFAAWVSVGFANPAERSDPAISGPNAMPAGDKVSNLMRYALGVGPYQPVIARLPQLLSSGSTYALRFPFDATKADLIWRVQTTRNLSAWTNVVFDSQAGPLPPLSDGCLTIPLPPLPGNFARLEIILRTH
jgi:autotransporter-associated beta strand protein